MEWLLHRLEMALPQPVLHGKATELVSGQSGRRDPGWVVVREVVVSGAHSLGSSTGVEEPRDHLLEHQGRLASGSDPQECTKIQRPGMTQEEVTYPGSPQPP